MLITFTTKAYADITLFGDIAQRLLTLMGHTGTVPSSILAEDVPAALERLKQALKEEQSAEQTSAEQPGAAGESSADDDEQDEESTPPVGLDRRAWPLIELLEAAAQQHKDVMWRQTGG